MTDEANLFSERLAEFAAGTVDAEMTAKLTEAVRGVKVTQKPATLTLTVTIAPHKASEDLANLAFKVGSKVPTRPLDPETVRVYGDGSIESLQN